MKDFSRVLQVIEWREPKLKFFNNRAFLNGLAHLSYADKVKVVESFLESVKLQTLLGLFKPFILKRDSFMFKLIFARVNSELESASKILKNYNKKCGKCVKGCIKI